MRKFLFYWKIDNYLKQYFDIFPDDWIKNQIYLWYKTKTCSWEFILRIRSFNIKCKKCYPEFPVHDKKSLNLSRTISNIEIFRIFEEELDLYFSENEIKWNSFDTLYCKRKFSTIDKNETRFIWKLYIKLWK